MNEGELVHVIRMFTDIGERYYCVPWEACITEDEIGDLLEQGYRVYMSDEDMRINKE